MDFGEHSRIVQVGTTYDVIRALRFLTDFPLQIEQVDAKIKARKATKFSERKNNKPKVKFGPHFFAKLNQFPAVSVEIKESRSQLRKTCYGFRDRRTGERVYLRIDPGSVLEVRDGICGYLVGTRFIVPRIDRMKPKRWDKLNRLLTRLMTEKGIIVTESMALKVQRALKKRVKLTKRLIALREFRIANNAWRAANRKKREEANKSLSQLSGLVRDSDSSGPSGSEP